MSRFLLLLVFVIWLPSPADSSLTMHGLVMGTWAFMGVYGLLVLVMRLWSQLVASRVHYGDLQRRLRRFNLMMYIARVMIPAWFAAGVFVLGWKTVVAIALQHLPLGRLPFDLPGLLLGSLPALLAWMGLWWAQYPADRALREQSLLIQLNESLPTYAPPRFWAYFWVNFRLQLLFTLAPVLALVFLRDILSLFIPTLLHHIPWLVGRDDLIEPMISLPSFALIFVFGPELLRWVLKTEPMPDSPLRRRLEAICKQHRVGYRDILFWHTQHHMGNAAVMGLIPQVRYVLLSDLLLETMSDEQIEAVFAHEIGHVMHKHLFWLVAAMGALMLAFAGPGQVIADSMSLLEQHHIWFPEALQTALLLAAGAGLFSLVFGYISRHCERQADVFAARTIQNSYEQSESPDSPTAETELAAPGPVPSYRSKTHVGQHGARIFCSALERVAIVNNIPIAARSWCHGSIAKRMRFLSELGHDPAKTKEFDRNMTRIFLAVIFSLCLFGAWAMYELARQG